MYMCAYRPYKVRYYLFPCYRRLKALDNKMVSMVNHDLLFQFYIQPAVIFRLSDVDQCLVLFGYITGQSGT